MSNASYHYFVVLLLAGIYLRLWSITSTVKEIKAKLENPHGN